MPHSLVTGMEAFLGLILGIVLYLFIPGQWARKRRKRKKALHRMHDSMAHRPEDGHPWTHSPSFQPSSPFLLPDRYEPVRHHESINGFHRRHVVPHRELLKNTGYLTIINALLDLLDEHGDCPSVVKLNTDREYREIRNSYDLLARISLLDHSLNVAEQMIRNVGKAGARDPEMLMGKILVTALAHDIGKIPRFMEGKGYSKGDHPYLSSLVLKRIVFTADAPQQEHILKAIREHHYPVREGLTYDLRKADQKAREIEAEKLSLQGEATTDLVNMIQERKVLETKSIKEPGAPSRPNKDLPEALDLSWLDLNEFLLAVEPLINLVEDGTRFRAFSMNNGLVYLMLSLVSDTVIRLAGKYDHPAILLNAGTKQKRRSIEFTIKTLLAKKGLIPSFIGEGYSGARFALHDKAGKKRMVGIYMPLEARAFNMPLAKLEKRKKTAPIISEIVEVIPLIGKGKSIKSL